MEITEDQLAIDWTLTEPDILFVINNSRGFLQNVKFAAQLCHLRACGRFIEPNDTVPITVINYLAKQFDGGPIYEVLSFDRSSHNYTQRERIRDHLGYKELDDNELSLLKEWLVQHLQEKVIVKAELIQRTNNYLLKRQVVLPSNISLGRIINKSIQEALSKFYESVMNTVSDKQIKSLEEMIKPVQKGLYSELIKFKQSPATANANQMKQYLHYCDQLENLGILECSLNKVHPDVIQHFAKMGRYYTVHQLREIKPKSKKLVIIICFLYDTAQNILDHLVEMHIRILTDINRRSNNEIKKARERLSKQNAGKFGCAGNFITEAYSQAETEAPMLSSFLEQFDKQDMLQSAEACKKIDYLGNTGLIDNIEKRFSYLRQYTKPFLKLNFEAKPGLSSLLNAIKILREYHSGKIKHLPDKLPIKILPRMWRKSIYNKFGEINVRRWELGVYFAMKKKLDSGDLFLAKSKNHRYFWDTIYNEEEWTEDKKQLSSQSELPNEFDTIAQELTAEYHQTAMHTKKSLPKNDFVSIVQGKLEFSKEDALFISPEVKKIRKIIQEHMPVIRIERLISEVAKISNFTDEFTPFHNKEGNIPKKPLWAAIIAHATNIGLYGMGNSVVGITTDTLKTASQVYIRPETLKSANKVLINHYLTYPITRCFGDGSWSSSDGQRYAIQVSSALSSYYPRYFGYYEKAISLYTHVLKHSVFGTQVISCIEREASYVLNGLVQNDTSLDPKFHCTDTHGYTEHLFALCYLLGFGFYPRLKGLKKQRIYRIDKTSTYGELDELFSGVMTLEIVKQNWDQIMRIIAAIRNGLVPAHIIIQKLANRTDNVSKALQALGRIVKTIYILRYIADEELRYKIHLHLNRGESRHQLAKSIFFVNRGVFKTSNYEEIMNKASCLSLLSNAILVWNTHHIQQIVDKLRAEGMEILDEHLEKISPLMFKHILFHGTYHFDDIGEY